MSEFKFTVNGKKCIVTKNSVYRDMTLNAYLRYELQLTGTKAMCREGGCGACIVFVSAVRYPCGDLETFSVNSCLVLVLSCHNWSITTVEGVGNRKEGYSEVQTRIANLNGTQCGYCTPGWVMHMHSLMDKNLTMSELEKSFGCNTCRCTGYRPILDTMKTFGTDVDPKLKLKLKDIEDLSICAKTNTICKETCKNNQDCDDGWTMLDEENKVMVMDLEYGKYYKVYEINQIFEVFKKEGTDSYMILDGNTGKGLYEHFECPRFLIDVSDVKALKDVKFDQNLIIGANMTLDSAITLFKNIAHDDNDFFYLQVIADHLENVAHLPVRKIGSLAGNLTMKKKIPSYQSDVFVLFESVGAMVTVRNNEGDDTILSLLDFLVYNMIGKVMISISLPPLNADIHKFKTYKIMPRNQNALAIVNAAFLLKINAKQKHIHKASIVYGNISSKFHHASKTEAFLEGKSPFSNATIQKAVEILKSELSPEDLPPKSSPECRKKLAMGLFYKFILSICPEESIKDRYMSGSQIIQRPLSHGTQDYQTDKTLYPLNEPVMKMESLIQSSGEALYANDIPSLPGQVFGAFVLATIHNGEIDNIDGTEAMKIPGVRGIYTSEDIPGKNSFIVVGINEIEIADVEILASSKISYYGQPVAVLVADTENLAFKIAASVKVTYKNVSDNLPVLNINEAKNDNNRFVTGGPSIEPKRKGSDVTTIIRGSYELPAQYFYYMESLACVVVPIDDKIEVYDSSQHMDFTQRSISQALNMKESNIFVKVRRLGGGFGGKLSNQCRVSTACALVATKLNLPCRFILPMQTNMSIVGKRIPCQTKYEVGVNDDGKIQYLNADVVEDQGYIDNENALAQLILTFPNCYEIDTWSVKTGLVLTDLPCNTYMRAPGSCEAVATIEQIMQHISFAIKKDPTNVRLINMRNEDNDLPDMIETLKKDSNYNERHEAIGKFNNANRWMKKAIQISVMSYPIKYRYNFHAVVAVYRGDGTVIISTGGIEMGQGINTKAAQTCAYFLDIPLHFITVNPSDSFSAANDSCTAASISSESVCYSVQKACEILIDRLKPVKEKMGNPTWLELIKQSAKDEINLTATYMNKVKEPIWGDYNAFSVGILEVQLDILTGRHEILRVDILEDVGVSINPDIDIGQIEGAYIQGIGYFTSEKFVFDQKTGKLLTNRSLNYHVPLALDIPVDFRVSLKRNSRNPNGALGTKAVGECGICLTSGITHALRQCILESREESGHDPDIWIDIDNPYDTESILKALDVYIEEFLIS